MDNVIIRHHIPEADFSMLKNDMHSMSNYQPGTEIICRKGILWVTQSGDVNDHILTTGEKFTSRKHGAVLIAAMRDSSAHIVLPGRHHKVEASAWPKSSLRNRKGL